jgi:hypothetical protein
VNSLYAWPRIPTVSILVEFETKGVEGTDQSKYIGYSNGPGIYTVPFVFKIAAFAFSEIKGTLDITTFSISSLIVPLNRLTTKAGKP